MLTDSAWPSDAWDWLTGADLSLEEAEAPTWGFALLEQLRHLQVPDSRDNTWMLVCWGEGRHPRKSQDSGWGQGGEGRGESSRNKACHALSVWEVQSLFGLTFGPLLAVVMLGFGGAKIQSHR